MITILGHLLSHHSIKDKVHNKDFEKVTVVYQHDICTKLMHDTWNSKTFDQKQMKTYERFRINLHYIWTCYRDVTYTCISKNFQALHWKWSQLKLTWLQYWTFSRPLSRAHICVKTVHMRARTHTHRHTHAQTCNVSVHVIPQSVVIFCIFLFICNHNSINFYKYGYTWNDIHLKSREFYEDMNIATLHTVNCIL